MDELTSLLGRERLLLELLVFKLVELRQLLASGEARFLAWAAAEVERATNDVREIELRRAVAVTRLADELGLADDEATLAVLTELAPAPYRGMFEEDRAALLELSGEVDRAVAAARRLARAGSADAGEELGVPVRRWAGAGATVTEADGTLLLVQERAGYDCARTVAAGASLPSLAQFLR